MAWFTDEQVARMARRENQIPNFVIEIISDNDIVDNLLDKLKDYHDADVAVIWLISPKLGQVHVYAGGEPAICTGAMICSAAPALPGFEMSVNDIFEQPVLVLRKRRRKFKLLLQAKVRVIAVIHRARSWQAWKKRLYAAPLFPTSPRLTSVLFRYR